MSVGKLLVQDVFVEARTTENVDVIRLPSRRHVLLHPQQKRACQDSVLTQEANDNVSIEPCLVDCFADVVVKGLLS